MKDFVFSLQALMHAEVHSVALECEKGGRERLQNSWRLIFLKIILYYISHILISGAARSSL